MSNDETIEFVLYHTDEIKRAIEEKRLDPCIPKSVGGHSKISDITATKALQNVSELPAVVVEYGLRLNGHGETRVIKKPERWLRVVKYIDTIYAGKPTAEVINRRYRMGEDWHKTCREMGISKDIYYVHKREILSAAEKFAIGIRLLPYCIKGYRE